MPRIELGLYAPEAYVIPLYHIPLSEPGLSFRTIPDASRYFHPEAGIYLEHMQTLILAGIAFPIMLVLDLIWIGVVAQGFYRSQLGSMLRLDVLWPAAIAFYVIFALAIAFFVLIPAISMKSLTHALLAGAFLGLAAYAAYDFTNLATITGWPLPLTFVDLLWGTVVTALTSVSAYVIATRFLGY